jgi:hypothetical protein
MALPYTQTKLPELNQLQTKWIQQINPVLALPLNNGNFLQNIPLTAGLNVVNHKLGRNLQGWFVVRVDTGTVIYDGQDQNPMQDLTLYLISGEACVVSLIVF